MSARERGLVSFDGEAVVGAALDQVMGEFALG